MPLVRLLREQLQRGPDQGVGLTQQLRGGLDVLGQLDVAGAGHQEPERDGLRVTVRELLRLGREDEVAPVRLKARQARFTPPELLDYLLA